MPPACVGGGILWWPIWRLLTSLKIIQSIGPPKEHFCTLSAAGIQDSGVVSNVQKQMQHGPRAVCCVANLCNCQFPLRPLAHVDPYRKGTEGSLVTEIGQAAFLVNRAASGLVRACVHFRFPTVDDRTPGSSCSDSEVISLPKHFS